VTLSRSEVVDPKGLIVSLYALHANPEQLQLEPFKSFKDFPGSMPYQGAFSANSERVLVPHVPLIKEREEDIKAVFDGEDGHDGDFSFILYPLPKIALYYIFYLPDEDFPASVTSLFCANALSFMPLDGLADVAEYTSKEIIRLVKNRSPAEGERSSKVSMILVLTLAAVIYFAGLSGYPLLDPDEGRYAEIPREMLESGDFITPHLNYVKYFEKPPLFYWAVAGSMALFGQHEWAVRIVPAMAGFLTVLLIMALGKRFFGMRTGVMAGWVYLTSMVPLILARLPIIDGLFSFFLTATWGAWWLGYAAPAGQIKRLWFCAAWMCMGLACMTKGIAAIALTGLILFAFIIVRRDFNALRAMAWLPGLLIFALIVLPWHLAVSSLNPEFTHFYFVVQHFGRLMAEEHSRPFWYFLVIFPAGMLFWTALFFPAMANAFKRAARAIKLPQICIEKKVEEEV